MRVTYSNGARFAGGGIGNTAHHAVNGLFRHQLLYRLICGSYRPTEIPNECIRSMGNLSRLLRKVAVYDKRGWFDYGYRLLYDQWATRQVEKCELFQGWSGYSLYSLQRAKALGAITVLDRALAHPNYVDRLLLQEHERWGLAYHRPRTVTRSRQEIDSADYVLIPSDFVYQTFQSEGEVVSKLISIPFGVDTNRFYPSSNPGVARPFRLLFVGQVSIRKGVPYLLDAWHRLNWQDAELWLVGQNKLTQDLLSRYRHLSGVCYIGYVADPVAVYQQADVFVFPSIAEGSALVTYEASACGLPVVTTLNAGSVIRDGIEGFITPIRDAETLAERLQQLRSDELLRRQMSKAARARAEQFTWERYGDTLATVLRRIHHARDQDSGA